MGSSSFSPFVQAGAGAMSYDIKNGVLDVKATNFAGNVGAGADVKVGSNMALRLLARDYIGKFNAKDATGFDFNTSTRNNWALTAGLRLSF
jgi:opacity protein-like surface antigen